MKAAIKSLGLTQKVFAEQYGCELRTMEKNLAGSTEGGIDLLSSFQQAGINANWLLTGEEPMRMTDLRPSLFSLSDKLRASMPLPGIAANQQRSDYVAIPLYSGVRAAAGAGAVVDHERPDDVLMFKESWIRYELGAKPKDLYLIRVAGDSMEPTLRSGDAILVDRRATTPDREGVYIIRMNGMLLVKRLQAVPGGMIRVLSDNHVFAAFDVTLSNLDGAELIIIGRVVWTGRRL